MPITRILPDGEQEGEITLDVFHVQEAVEVYDGALALAVDHLLNHIKTLVTLAYLPGSQDLDQALGRHPVLKRMIKGGHQSVDTATGRSPERVLLNECHRLLDGVLEVAHLAAWPETAQEAQVALAKLRKEVPFLDYRYDNDPYPSDKDHEG